MKYFYPFLVLIGLFILPLVSFAFEGPAGCSMDKCSTCHSLTPQEAEEMLKLKNAKISDAPTKGIWQIEGTLNGKPVRVHLDFAKKYVLLIQNFIPVESIGKQPEMRTVDVKDVPLSGSLLLGSKKAKNKFIVFSDPDCPYCRKFHMEMKKLVKERKDVAFYVKPYPLPMHPESYEKSKTVLCENSHKLLDDAFEGKPVPKANCDTLEVDKNIETAKKLGINGTPAIILPDGRIVPGYVDGNVLMEMMESPDKK